MADSEKMPIAGNCNASFLKYVHKARGEVYNFFDKFMGRKNKLHFRPAALYQLPVKLIMSTFSARKLPATNAKLDCKQEPCRMKAFFRCAWDEWARLSHKLMLRDSLKWLIYMVSVQITRFRTV